MLRAKSATTWQPSCGVVTEQSPQTDMCNHVRSVPTITAPIQLTSLPFPTSVPLSPINVTHTYSYIYKFLRTALADISYHLPSYYYHYQLTSRRDSESRTLVIPTCNIPNFGHYVFHDPYKIIYICLPDEWSRSMSWQIINMHSTDVGSHGSTVELL